MADKLLSERGGEPELVQPGDRKWVTVIQSIYADGSYTLPFIIYKGRVHISAWYKEASIPHSRKLSVSENGWTNNALGLEWLKYFNAHTKARQVGAYRLLILDGHKSQLNQEFKNYCGGGGGYCLENKIFGTIPATTDQNMIQGRFK
jgi:hypothetical protein